MILRVYKNQTLCLALLEWLSPHHQGCAFPLPCKCTSLRQNITFIKVCGVSYSSPNSVLIYTLCFSRKKLLHVEKHLPQWVSSSKQEAPIPQQDRGLDWSVPREPAAGNLSASFFCDGGVSIWPRISPSRNSTLSDTGILWFLSTEPLFPLFLCVCTVN